MRVVVRKTVDIDSSVNLRRLSPKDKLIVAIKNEWTTTSWYRSSKEKSQQELRKRVIEREDRVKDLVLTKIHQELDESKFLKKSGMTAKEIIILVDAEFEDVLFDKYDEDGELRRRSIFLHNEFAPYNVTAVEEDSDIRKCFSDMPYMFRVSKKTID